MYPALGVPVGLSRDPLPMLVQRIQVAQRVSSSYCKAAIAAHATQIALNQYGMNVVYQRDPLFLEVRMPPRPPPPPKKKKSAIK